MVSFPQISVFFACFVSLAVATPIILSSDTHSKCGKLECAIGKIQLTLKNGTSIGFVSKFYDHFVDPVGGPTTIPAFTNAPEKKALVVTLPSRDLNVLKSSVFNIRIDSPPDKHHKWLGAAEAVPPQPLKTGQSGSAFLTGSSKGPVTVPSLSNSFGTPGESKIWSLDCSRYFATTWRNSDGTDFPTTFFFTPTGQPHSSGLASALGIAGDLTAVSNTNLVTLLEVKLKFVPHCHK